MKTTVIHHSADFDGIFCREIARKFLPDAELIGWDYGNELIAPHRAFPDPNAKLYILDLSPECVDGIGGFLDQVVWIDHHKSAIDKFPSTIPGYRIDGVAACRLAWQWFIHGGHETESGALAATLMQKPDYVDRKVSEPLAVRLAGEYDIWDKRDPNAELFQHGLRSQCLDGLWPILLSTEGDWPTKAVTSLLNAGTAIQYAKSEENASIVKAYGFDVDFEGLKFLACNHARFNSQLFTAGVKPEHDALLGFNWSGKDWRVSLYHAPGKEHHDLSQIAVKHGGGGHRGACGFRANKLPFLT